MRIGQKAGNRPIMVKVAWKAPAHLSIIPHYWGHAAQEIWLVMGQCAHWSKPALVRSKRSGGPLTVACYECAALAK